MSSWMYKWDGVQDVSGTVGAIAQCFGDTEADKPARGDFTGYTLLAQSTFHAIAEGTDWMMDTSGTWHKQPDQHTTQLDLSGYYTKAEVDAAVATINAAIDLTYKLNTSTVLSDPDPDHGVYADLWDTSLPFGTYLRSSNVSDVQHLPTGFTGGFKVVIERGLTNARRVLTLFKISGTGSVGDEFYRCILGTGGTGTWYKYTGSAV